MWPGYAGFQLMARINLLPHRQLKRAERQRQFNLFLVATVIAGGAIVFMGQTFISTKIDAQSDRNRRLEEANTKLDKEIAEIEDLKGQIQDVLARKQVVENLQSNRSQAVIVLDEISRQLPEGVYLKTIKQQGPLINLQGIADTNARVATLVRNLSASQWMESPNLIEIKATTVNNLKYNDFILSVNLKVQQPPEVAAGPKKKGKK
jgi:type IV pilus assembly protein PilN